MSVFVAALGPSQEESWRPVPPRGNPWPTEEVTVGGSVRLWVRNGRGLRRVVLRDATTVILYGEGPGLRYAEKELSALEGSGALVRRSLHETVARFAVAAVMIAPDGGDLTVFTEHSGSFPLFALQTGPRHVVSNDLTRVAALGDVALDPRGLTEFLLRGYNLGEGTLASGVRLVPPARIFTLTADGPRAQENAHPDDPYASRPDDGPSSEAADAYWELLLDSLQAQDVPSPGLQAIMMSGGWDSRTLLAAMKRVNHDVALIGYSHGDVESRELAIVTRVANLMGIRAHLEPIGHQILTLEFLDACLRDVSSAQFPHWRLAGTVLSSVGVSEVAAGVFGEVVGGHYGSTMVDSPLAKMAAVVFGHIPLRAERKSKPTPATVSRGWERIVRVHQQSCPWYLREDLWNERDWVAETNHVAEREIDVLRGGLGPIDALERFYTRFRGGQFISGQLRSVLPHTDVNAPFARGHLLRAAWRIPFDRRIHNRENRRFLGGLVEGRRLLEVSTAACLVPARSPILVQEMSRAVRKLIEARKRRRGLRPQFSWVNFEFARSTSALEDMVDALQLSIWDKPRMLTFVQRCKADSRVDLHPVINQLLHVYTADSVIRR